MGTFGPVSGFFQKYKAHLIVGVVCIVAGVGTGWYAKPDVVKIEEKTKIEYVEKQVVVVQEKVQIVHVKDTTVVERWHREKTETKTPDGTVVTKEIEDKNIDTHTKENTETVKVVEVTKEVVVEKEVVKEVKIDPVLAQWHVGALVGVAPRFDNPATTPIMLGVEAERRILGPIWLGGWVMAGSPVTAFGITNAAVGLKVAGEF